MTCISVKKYVKVSYYLEIKFAPLNGANEQMLDPMLVEIMGWYGF